MQELAQEAQKKGALIAYGAEVTKISKKSATYQVSIRKNNYAFETKSIVNCAGLAADQVAAMAGIDIDQAGYRLHFCRGDYFRANRKFNICHLVYPVPAHDAIGLGIHLTKDLAGGIRFGPDTAYIQELNYQVDASKRGEFCRAIQKYLPSLRPEDISPDMAGVRPKLQGPQDGFRDFVIREEADRGLPNFVNLLGIESPGLTSALAIAAHVERII